MVLHRFRHISGKLGDMSNFTLKHVFVSQKVCKYQSFILWTRSWTCLLDDTFVWKHDSWDRTKESRWHTDIDIRTCPPMWKFTRDEVFWVKSCIVRRSCKVVCTPFPVHIWEVRWQKPCHMLNVTQIHVFVSQEVYRNTSFSVRTRAWRRLVVDKFAWKHVGRD